MGERIYVIEDDDNIQEIINLTLTSNGYQVHLFDNALDAIEAFDIEVPDLAIFDIMLPSMDGITAIKKLRKKHITIPILILSAKDREIDKVHGLDSGSDDYMTKPFGVLELSARVRSLLRRNKKLSSEQLITKTLFVDKQTRTIKKDNEVLDLTNKEYQLLLYLMENHFRVVEREELLHEIWGFDFIGESRAIDVHIRALRSKLDDDGTIYIKTIRSVGYRFIEEGGIHE